ncbi:hypothetical protein D1872_333820 [compost metagenome]
MVHGQLGGNNFDGRGRQVQGNRSGDRLLAHSGYSDLCPNDRDQPFYGAGGDCFLLSVQ